MSEHDDGFLNRWSRRKSETQSPDPAELSDGAESEEAAVDRQKGDEAEIDEAEIVAKLPDIDSLDETSDYSVFLQRGVPDALRRQALRKLWRINPVFSVLDGMNEYDEDYSIATTLAEGVKTVYQVGKGMVSDDEPPSDAEVAEPDAMAGTVEGETGEQVAEKSESEENGEASETPAEASLETTDSEVAEVGPPELGEAKVSLSDDVGATKAPSGRTAAERRWGAFRG